MSMNPYVLELRKVGQSQFALVGGKGANLGELARMEGIQVPGGFCITTLAYREMVGEHPEIQEQIAELSELSIGENEKIREMSGRIRNAIERLVIDQEIVAEIDRCLTQFGDKHAYAVRSSATAEDLPSASFAGQQDTYLNVIGKEAIIQHIGRCWASLFSERAVTYRMQNGFDHHKVELSVIVQRMVFPQASGIMFTADPVTSNRKVLSIDAGFGLGEALVSGLVNADIYKVRDGRIIEKKISSKNQGIYALEQGGTVTKEIEAGRRNAPVLTEEQILLLERAGRQIEARFGCPQDIEWCLDGGELYIVQSRPITTLFPVPDLGDEGDGKTRVFISFGHRQMMTEAMSPLGISFFQTLFKQLTNSILYEAGGRLYIDASKELRSPFTRKYFIQGLETVDVLMQNACRKVVGRKDFIRHLHRSKKSMVSMKLMAGWGIKTIQAYRKNDPALVESFMERIRAQMRDMEQQAAKVSGDEIFDFITRSTESFKQTMFGSYGVVFAAAYATTWLNKHIRKWLGDKNAADTLVQSAPNNITSEMGLELLDVADVVRKYPEVMDYFQHPGHETFFDDLAKLGGGLEVSRSIREYLKKYGMRCSAEIDISRTRWNEKPTILVPMILGNVKANEPNARMAKFEQGLLEAKQRERDILERLERLPGGKRKARKAKKAISVLRHYAGYREFNKYSLVWYEWIVKQALMQEAELSVKQGIIRDKEDIYYLTLEELREAMNTNGLEYGIIEKRKEEYASYRKLTPPRVLTSEGEIISGEYDTGRLPQGALAGVPVSSGVVEGRARVIFRMEDADMEEGDILVTPFTDPSWTPVFVTIKGLVTEVGGMMTHGAVVAREYGLPAVVSVENATGLIQDGQRIRINGTDGYVELL
ncbi:MAG: pyruvate phosphate dikinase PEP/pyruvate-binding protein [Paenibacillaceae bacterium]|nr:pyruvate phosphate dikinase PEP/pyruvate-binding protein [Paenibacillaceae bacterium]